MKAWALGLLNVIAVVRLAAQVPDTAQWRRETAAVTWEAEGLITLDCTTTALALHRGEAEVNPWLGRHPTPLKLWAACATAGVALGSLPPKVRRPVAIGVILVEFYNLMRWGFPGAFGKHR